MTSPLRQAIDLASIFRRIKVNVGILLGGTGVVTLLNFATAAVNARAVGAAGLGVIALFQASALIVIGLVSFGLQQPVIRLGKQALEDGRPERVGAVVSLALLVDFGTSIAAGILSLVAIAVGYRYLGLAPEYLWLAQFYTIVIFFSGTSAINGVFRLFDRFYYLSVAQVGGALAMLVASLAFYRIDAPLSWYLLANAVILAVTAQTQVLLALQLLRRNGIRLTAKPEILRSAGIGREFFSYAWTTGVTSTIGTLRANGESVLLGILLGPAPVGVYHVVKQITGALNKVSAASSSAVFPEISALASQRRLDDARGVVRKVAQYSVAFGACAVLASAALGGFVLEIGFGAEFRSGWAPLVLLAMAGTLTFASAPYSMFVQAVVSPRSLMRAHLCSFLAYVVCAPALIYSWGMTGAAVAQVVFAAALLTACWILHRAGDERPA